MSTIIESIEKEQLRSVPRFQAGDRVRVHFQVIEGSRTRTQVFEGVVIKRQGSGARETFTVRKQSFGVGVERMFPLHSPKIQQLEVAARGDVRRAKLYYLRDRVGKAARVAERRWGITDDVLAADEGAIDSEGASQAEVEAAEVEAAEGEQGEEPKAEAQQAEPEEPKAEAAEAEQADEPEAEAEKPKAEAPEAEQAEEPEAEADAPEGEGDDAAEAEAEDSPEAEGEQADSPEAGSADDEASERDD